MASPLTAPMDALGAIRLTRIMLELSAMTFAIDFRPMARKRHACEHSQGQQQERILPASCTGADQVVSLLQNSTRCTDYSMLLQE